MKGIISTNSHEPPSAAFKSILNKQNIKMNFQWNSFYIPKGSYGFYETILI